MSAALYLADIDGAAVGTVVRVTGDEAKHAVTVARTKPGEVVLLSDGKGSAVSGPVVSAVPGEMLVEVAQVLSDDSAVEFVAVQGLAKGDRSERAVEMLVEVGARRIVAWQASRSIVRWQGDRGAKSLAKWQSTATAAMKQSRRFHLPQVEAASTKQVAALLAGFDLALVLHEEATEHIADVELPATGSIAVVIGPEGGISPEELDAFREAGARLVLMSDGVLRTSTAGAVAVGQLHALLAARGRA